MKILCGVGRPGVSLSTTILCGLTWFLLACNNSTQKEYAAAYRGDIIACGTVQFSDGCGKGADSSISYGLALVHHMTYDEAEKVFEAVIKAKPECFWGYWGKALTYIHPLWPDEPSKEQMRTGLELTQKALELASKQREKVFGAALAAFYEDGLSKTQKERLKSFADAWAAAFQQLPDDQEAKSFYALSLIATAQPSDKTYQNQIRAGTLMEEVLQVIPDHPGGFHYLIHAYDYPELANKALQAAAKYDKIAPNVPHALHMPTHIFTRRGMWKESIEWNLRSADAASKHPVNGSISMHYFHALDYLVYAYLQRQEDSKAQKILDEIKSLKGPFQSHPATAYTLAAAEGRYALERQQWEKAANITPRIPTHFDWEKYPENEALTHFAIGMGAARSGATEKAKAALLKMDELQQKTGNPYWKEQIEIQKNSIKAWLAFVSNNKKDALALMTMAAKQESATNKHPVTPGELLPATELLGDLLIALQKPEEAIAQYENALKRSPGRMNSLAGAARAARLSGDTAKEKYYMDLLNLHTKGGAQENDTTANKAIAKRG